jgi:hypothetical protein
MYIYVCVYIYLCLSHHFVLSKSHTHTHTHTPNTQLRFTGKELENLKAAAMEPLKALKNDNIWVSTSNALCAHLWPILSPLLLEKDETDTHTHTPEVDMGVIVNYRKAIGLGPMYFGNAVGMKQVPSTTPLVVPGMVSSRYVYMYIYT